MVGAGMMAGGGVGVWIRQIIENCHHVKSKLIDCQLHDIKEGGSHSHTNHSAALTPTLAALTPTLFVSRAIPSPFVYAT